MLFATSLIGLTITSAVTIYWTQFLWFFFFFFSFLGTLDNIQRKGILWMLSPLCKESLQEGQWGRPLCVWPCSRSSAHYKAWVFVSISFHRRPPLVLKWQHKPQSVDWASGRLLIEKLLGIRRLQLGQLFKDSINKDGGKWANCGGLAHNQSSSEDLIISAQNVIQVWSFSKRPDWKVSFFLGVSVIIFYVLDNEGRFYFNFSSFLLSHENGK